MVDPWILWIKMALLALNAVVIPLVTPRIYVPVELGRPSPEPSPEQTSNRLSLMTFSFLDPMVWKANTAPHFSRDDLPPMPDYDGAGYLKRRSLKVRLVVLLSILMLIAAFSSTWIHCAYQRALQACSLDCLEHSVSTKMITSGLS